MSNPKLTLEITLLRQVIIELHKHFEFKLAVDVDGKYIRTSKHVSSPEHVVEQIIFSAALVIHLLQDDLRFLKNSNEIESNAIRCIGSIVADNESLWSCTSDCSNNHTFFHLRFYQYLILLDKYYSEKGEKTPWEIYNFLYLNPMISGLLFSYTPTRINDARSRSFTKVLFSNALKDFTQDFTAMIKPSSDELTTLFENF